MRRLILPMTCLMALSTAALSQPASPGPRLPNGLSGNQSNGASDAAAQDRRAIAPALPAPNVLDTNQPSDILRSAEDALSAGHRGQAQEALEMAQTRLLDRSVPQGHTHAVSDNPTIGQISQALQALAGHDRATCMQLIEAAIGSAIARGL